MRDSLVDVFRVLAGEREYQDDMTLSDDRPDMVEIGIAGVLLAQRKLLDDAIATWYTEAAPYPKTMELMRKVGGLAVKAGELYGMPRREGY